MRARHTALLTIVAFSIGLIAFVASPSAQSKPVPGFADYGKWESLGSVGGGGGRVAVVERRGALRKGCSRRMPGPGEVAQTVVGEHLAHIPAAGRNGIGASGHTARRIS